MTALEIKTGKNKTSGYRGQVIIYSLLISERFKNSNPDNILLYIMDQNLTDGFILQNHIKQEVDSLIIGRNELAKWNKENTKKFDNMYVPALPARVQLDPSLLEFEQDPEMRNKIETEIKKINDIKVVHNPPMAQNASVCKSCYSREICTL